MASVKKVLTQYLKDKYNYTVGKDFVIFGIRGAVPDSDGDLIPSPQTFDKYDDTIGFLNKDSCHVYLGTVDPGKKYTDQPMNVNGCAHMVNGFYDYKRGIHIDHPAFIQAGKIKIWRDKNRNGINDDGIIEEGFFAVDLHAGSGNKLHIYGWSAGCQNTCGDWNSKDWKEFQSTLYASPQEIFKYCLLDFFEIEKELDK